MTTKNNNKNSTKDNAGKITISKDGPYIVSGTIPLYKESTVQDKEGMPLSWALIKQYPSSDNYAFCRCGKSKNKPYCDGNHAITRFDGTETATRESHRKQAEEIQGPALVLKDARDLCSGTSFCHRASGIWNLVRKSDDPHAKSIAIEIAGNCPSGRLVVRDKKTIKALEPEFQPSISLIEEPAKGVSGPIWAKGGIKIVSPDNKGYETRNRVTLCRCGKSGNKPFCDGSHASARFRDE